MSNTRRNFNPIYAPISAAISARDLEMMKKLLNSDDGVSLPERYIHFLLYWAARQDWDYCLEACRLLIDRLSLKYKKRYSRTKCLDSSPLHGAVSYGRLETVQLLLPMFNVNIVNALNRTPLWDAAWRAFSNNNDGLAICQLLLENGANAKMQDIAFVGFPSWLDPRNSYVCC
jgi:ankyrin repeat protein